MIIVKRLNKILKVSDVELKKYLANGFDQVDEEGNVIKFASGGSKVTQKQYRDLLAENDKLKQEIEELKKRKRSTKKEA